MNIHKGDPREFAYGTFSREDSPQKEPMQFQRMQFQTLQDRCELYEQEIANRDKAIDSLQDQYSVLSDNEKDRKEETRKLEYTTDLLKNTVKNLESELKEYRCLGTPDQIKYCLEESQRVLEQYTSLGSPEQISLAFSLLKTFLRSRE